MGVASRFELARQAVLRRQFVGESLVLNEAVLASQMDSLFVQWQGIGVSPFETSDLRRHQCVLVCERWWIVFGPFIQLFPVPRQEFAPRLLLIGRRGFIERRR